MSDRQTAELYDWYYWNGLLYGTVKGHPLIDDGAFVHTSLVLSIDFENKTARTKNTDYTLSHERNSGGHGVG